MSTAGSWYEGAARMPLATERSRAVRWRQAPWRARSDAENSSPAPDARMNGHGNAVGQCDEVKNDLRRNLADVSTSPVSTVALRRQLCLKALYDLGQLGGDRGPLRHCGVAFFVGEPVIVVSRQGWRRRGQYALDVADEKRVNRTKRVASHHVHGLQNGRDDSLRLESAPVLD